MIAMGMDGMGWLEMKDPFDRSIMQAITAEAYAVRRILDNNLAAEITKGIAKLLGG